MDSNEIGANGHGKKVGAYSLSRHLAAGLTGAVVLVSAIMIAALYLKETSEQEALLAQKADEYRDYLVKALEPPLWGYDENTINAICNSFSQNELVVGITLKDASGQPIRFPKEKGDPHALVRTGKIFHEGTLLGQIELSLTKRFATEAGDRLVFTYATIMLFVSVALMFLTHLFVRVFLRKPIETLDKLVGPYAAGIYNSPIAELPYLEFKPFGKTLAQMGETIRLQVKKISEAEAKYRGIFENALEGIFQVTPEGNYLNVNPAFAKIHGHASPAEFLASVAGVEHPRYVNPKDRQKFMRDIEANGVVEGFEAEMYRSDGSAIWGSINAHAVRGQEGWTLYYEGSLEDITTRKRAEEKLRRMNRELRAISDCNQTLMRADDEQALLNEICHIICAEAGYRMAWVGYAEKDEAKTVRPVAWAGVDDGYLADAHITWADTERGRGPTGSTIRSGTSSRIQDFAVDTNATPWRENALRRGYRSTCALPLKDETAKTFGALNIYSADPCAFTSDETRLLEELAGNLAFGITVLRTRAERKRAEEEIRHLKNYLSNIIDSMPSMLVGLDHDQTVTQWNLQAEKSTGITAAAAIGHPIAQLFPEFAPWIEAMRGEILQRRPSSLEKLLVERQGERHFYDLMLYPLITNGVEGAVVRIEDVTERARVQEMLVQAEKMMSVGGLAAGMAHEINNPLGIIIQSVQNIERRVSPDLPANLKAAQQLGVNVEAVQAYLAQRQVLEFIDCIETAATRAAKIVANMLQFSRGSASTMRPTSLAALMEQALELAANDYDLKKKYDFRSVEIVRDYAPDMPAVPVVPVELEQVMLNLLKNAAQAMVASPQDRKPRIILRLRHEERYARLEVEDNGPGMEEEVRRRVFEPFFTTKKPGAGTGLGLSVSYMLVTQNHKGLMEVASSPGNGACFKVRLPLSTQLPAPLA